MGLITRGLTDSTIITRGLGSGIIGQIVRDIARLTSAVVLSVSLSSPVKFTGAVISRVIKNVNLISKLDLEEDD
jgi:hypothetical protein